MLTTYTESYGAPLLVGSDKLEVIGYLRDIVIDPDSGKFVAFWVQGLSGLRLLLPEDIKTWGTEGLRTESLDNLVNPEEIHRLKAVFSKECRVLGAKVFEAKTQQKIGWVQNIAFDTHSLRILALNVAGGWFGWRKQQILYKNIDRITDQGVFVNQILINPNFPIKTQIKTATGLDKKGLSRNARGCEKS